MDLTMESDAMSEISDISTATSARSKKLRFRTATKKQKAEKDHKSQSHPVKSLSTASSSKSSSILSLSRRSGQKGMEKSKSVSEEVRSEGGEGGKEDAAIRFSGEGVCFKAKLIGIDPVTGPRGDQMCKNAMTRLKAIVKGTGSHKRRIILSISLDGLKLMDEKTREDISQHPIPLISYISRDTSDSRAFGFVYGSPSEGHQFIGIKTEKAAIPVMQTIADLFTFVFEQRKREKSLPKDNTTQHHFSSTASSPSRNTDNSSAAVLSFGAKEEFSTEKVNAAWTRTEPLARTHNLSSTTSSSSPPAAIGPLPPLLPPPKTGDSSRASTMNSGQRSDVLSELRSMRHVINSAREAVSAGDNNRYATWESFDENHSESISSQANDAFSRSKAESAVHFALEPNRTTSMRSIGSDTVSEFSTLSHKSLSSSGRPQHPSVGMNSGSVGVPSPPSSPRSISSRLRRGRTIDQPNTVALPPIRADSFTQSTATMLAPRQVPAAGTTTSPAAISSFPARSEPQLFHESSDKFEVNFDAVFSNSSMGPPLPTTAPVNPISSQQSKSAATSTRHNDPNDRYAVFQEIQNLDAFPSIFDNNLSSGSDSDTLTPVKSAYTSSNAGPKNIDTDLFGSSNWVPSQQADVLPFPPPLVPMQINSSNSNSSQSRGGIVAGDASGSYKISNVPVESNVTNKTCNSKFSNLKDTATSPGTPPSPIQSQVSSHGQHSQRDTSSRNNSSHDPFSELNFKDLQSISGNQNLDKSLFFQDLGNDLKKSQWGPTTESNVSRPSVRGDEKSHRVGSCPEGETHDNKTHETGRYSCLTASSIERPPSSASSVASSFRNPFAPDDMDDVRSTHSENEHNLHSYSAAAPASTASSFHASQMSRPMYPKHAAPNAAAAAATFHAMMSHYGFDPFSFPPYLPPNIPPATQMYCHHHMPGQMHPECDCHYYYRHTDPRHAPDPFHPDPRYQYFSAMYQKQQRLHQHQQQQKNAPTEFGSSFDFDQETETPRYSDSRYYPHHAFQHQGPSSSDSRCLSPNNPFSPVFAEADAPPRPPNRNADQQRRPSFDVDAPPPPLPKRKITSLEQAYHTHRDATENRYAYPPGEDMDAASPPPLPLPSRKKPQSMSNKPQLDRRVSFDTPAQEEDDDPSDPFNVAYIDKHLSEVCINKNKSSDRIMSSLEKAKKVQTSTPLPSASGQHRKPDGLNLSSIKAGSDSEHSVLNASASAAFNDSVFESSPRSAGFDAGGYKRLDGESSHAKQNDRESHQHQQEDAEREENKSKGPFKHFGEDHISPPERNIFRKSDPFADDDFFKQ